MPALAGITTMDNGGQNRDQIPMTVHIIADTVTKLSTLRAMLESQHALTSELLSGASDPCREADAVVVTADLRVVENIAALKQVLEKLGHVRKRIFLIGQKARLFTVQAYALGATRVLISPIDQADLLAQLADPSSSETGLTEASRGAAEAATKGAIAIGSMFSAVLSGKPIDVRSAEGARSGIADSIAEDGLSGWLETVRRYHEGTYQHCLLVTGIAVDFGLSLGLAKPDIERLYSAAMFHDIGKAKIPLAVLDKPGRLDPQERALIETHPAAGYEVLKGNAGISPEILDAVRHHHEYLDGSGYPDALCGASISDIVRMLTISDIFAALIEHRHYKPSMPREQAYEIIRSMHGKLEMPLVSAFKDVALNR
jgi:putative nucleotidyltransferase with HDIG domain